MGSPMTAVESASTSVRSCRCRGSFPPGMGKHLEQAALDPGVQKVRGAKDNKIMFIASREKTQESPPMTILEMIKNS